MFALNKKINSLDFVGKVDSKLKLNNGSKLIYIIIIENIIKLIL